jgi:hypothetical protein
MRTLRVILLVAAIACTGLVVFVRHDYQTTPGGEVIESRTRIGFPPSPWYERVERAGGVTSEVNLLSLSAVFGLVAVAGFLGYARLR